MTHIDRPSVGIIGLGIMGGLMAETLIENGFKVFGRDIEPACNQRLQNCEPEAVGHWVAILRGLDAARISTIHSFCTSLLRSQAVDAGLDPRFSVLEPSLADTLLRNAAKETVHALLEQNDEDACEFVFQFGLEKSRELIRSLVGTVLRRTVQASAPRKLRTSVPAGPLSSAAERHSRHPPGLWLTLHNVCG